MELNILRNRHDGFHRPSCLSSVGSAHLYNEAILIKTQILLFNPASAIQPSIKQHNGWMVAWYWYVRVTNPCFHLLGYACNSITGTSEKSLTWTSTAIFIRSAQLYPCHPPTSPIYLDCCIADSLLLPGCYRERAESRLLQAVHLSSRAGREPDLEKRERLHDHVLQIGAGLMSESLQFCSIEW